MVQLLFLFISSLFPSSVGVSETSIFFCMLTNGATFKTFPFSSSQLEASSELLPPSLPKIKSVVWETCDHLDDLVHNAVPFSLHWGRSSLVLPIPLSEYELLS